MSTVKGSVFRAFVVLCGLLGLAPAWFLVCCSDDTDVRKEDSPGSTYIEPELDPIKLEDAEAWTAPYLNIEFPKSTARLRGRRDVLFAEVIRMEFDCVALEAEGFLSSIYQQIEGEKMPADRGKKLHRIVEKNGNWISIRIRIIDKKEGGATVKLVVKVENAK